MQANHFRSAAEQIARHEITHKKIANGEIDVDEVKKRIAENYDVDEIAEKYAEAYKGSGMTVEEAFEEIICDAEAGMNVFEESRKSEEEIRQYGEVLAETKQAAEESNPRAPPTESGIKSSREIENNSEKITVSDIQQLREIANAYNGERVSVNDLTSEEIRKLEPWARKFWIDLREKSPFFRKWFGDWRAYDTSTVSIVPVETTNISKADLEYGNYHINDTDWDVYAGRTLKKDTTHHSGGERINVKSLSAIKSILANAVLFDTVVSENDTDTKAKYTAFLHKFVTPIEYGEKMLIAITTVEEYFDESTNAVEKRAYNLKTIKIESADGRLEKISTSPMSDTDSNVSISDLFNLVKTYDKEFSPNPVNPLLLDENGKPRVFYHGTNAKFSIFKKGEKNGFLGKGIYLTANRDYASENGKNIMELYASIKKPFVIIGDSTNDILREINEKYPEANDFNISEILKSNGYDSVIFTDWDKGLILNVFDQNQIKSATDNIGTFDGSNPDIRYSREITPEEDAEYLELAKEPEKNYDKLAKMVEKAARKAGYDYHGYHFTNNTGENYERFTVFDPRKQGRRDTATFFHSDIDAAGSYGIYEYDEYLRIDNPLIIEAGGDYWGAVKDHSNTETLLWKDLSKEQLNYLAKRYDMSINDVRELWEPDHVVDLVRTGLIERAERDTNEWAAYAKKNGYDGVIFKNIRDNAESFDDTLGTVYAVLSSKQIKSADPVTYDDNGNIIPLSERFNTSNNDIRFSQEIDTQKRKTALESARARANAAERQLNFVKKQNDTIAIIDKINEQKSNLFENASETPKFKFYGILGRFGRILRGGNISANTAKSVMQDLRTWYNESPAFMDADGKKNAYYNGDIAAMIDSIADADIKDNVLTDEQMNNLNTVMRYFSNFIRNYGKVKINGQLVEAMPLVKKYVAMAQNVKMRGVNKALFNRYLRKFADPQFVLAAADGFMGGNQQVKKQIGCFSRREATYFLR